MIQPTTPSMLKEISQEEYDEMIQGVNDELEKHRMNIIKQRSAYIDIQRKWDTDYIIKIFEATSQWKVKYQKGSRPMLSDHLIFTPI